MKKKLFAVAVAIGLLCGSANAQMKVWQALHISAPADAQVHGMSVQNPFGHTIYIRKIVSVRGGNYNAGQGSNFWVCLPPVSGVYQAVLITQHFNPPYDSATKQFDYSAPFVLDQDHYVQIGIYGTGNGGDMTGGVLIFYTEAP